MTESVTVTVKPLPEVTSFIANPSVVICPNSPCTSTVSLSWDVTGAETLSINQGVGPVTDQGLITGSNHCDPQATITYTLTATNSSGSITKNVIVSVLQVKSFSADPAVIINNEHSVLRWDVSGEPDSISIRNNKDINVLDVTGSSSNIVTPEETTEYTLRIEKNGETIEESVIVYRLKIKSFTADPESITEGESTFLDWDIDGEPTEVSINHDVGDVTGLTSTSVSPEQTTTYTLTAKKTDGSRTRTINQSLRVTVTPAGTGFSWGSKIQDCEECPQMLAIQQHC